MRNRDQVTLAELQTQLATDRDRLRQAVAGDPLPHDREAGRPHQSDPVEHRRADDGNVGSVTATAPNAVRLTSATRRPVAGAAQKVPDRLPEGCGPDGQELPADQGRSEPPLRRTARGGRGRSGQRPKANRQPATATRRPLRSDRRPDRARSEIGSPKAVDHRRRERCCGTLSAST